MVGRRGWKLAVAGSSLVSLIGCSSGNSGAPGTGNDAATGSSDDGGMRVVGADGGVPDATDTASQTIGAAGGTLSATGVTVTVPAGALATSTAITAAASGAPAPAGYTALSPVFSFGPAGTTFLVPVTIDIAVQAPPPDATIFWSNASGGWDPLPTTVVTDGVSASVDRAGNGFCGVKKAPAEDAATDGETDAGSTSSGQADSGDVDTGTSTGQADAGPTDSGQTGATDAGPADSGPADAGSGSVDSGTTDSGGGSSGDAGASDASASDAGTPGITVTIDGVPTTLGAHMVASSLQAWWGLSADDSATASHWTLRLVTPQNAGGLNCQGGIYPEITYTHYTAASDGGVADLTYTTASSGASCFIDETSTATVQGQHATGTFSGTLVQSGDAGSAPSHTFTAGSYDFVVP